MKDRRVCRHFHDDLILLAYDEPITPERKKEIEGHLGKCSACRNELAQLRLLRKKVKESSSLDDLPEKFWESSLESVRGEICFRNQTTSRITQFFSMISNAKLVVPVVVTCLLLFALIIGTGSRRSSPNKINVSGRANVARIIQPETNDKQIVAQIEVLENLDVLENILNIVEKERTDQG